jgi:hypothetical protein
MYGIDAALIALGLAGSVVPCCRAFHWTSSQERWLATYGSEPAGENFKCSITGRKAILPTLVRLSGVPASGRSPSRWLVKSTR